MLTGLVFLVHIFCRLLQLLCVHLCNDSIISGRLLCSALPQILALRIVPSPSSVMIPESYFLHFNQLWVSGLTTIHYTKQVFLWGLRDVLICGYRNIHLEGSLILCSFGKIIVVVFLRPLNSPTYVWGQICSTTYVFPPVDLTLNSIRRQLVVLQLLYAWKRVHCARFNWSYPTQGTMLIPKSIGWQTKKSSARCGNESSWLLVRGCPGDPQTVTVIAIALGCPPQVDGKVLLLKKPHSQLQGMETPSQ